MCSVRNYSQRMAKFLKPQHSKCLVQKIHRMCFMMRTCGPMAAFFGTGFSGIRLRMNLNVQSQLILTMAQVNSAGLRLCSFNMHGFNIGNVCLRDLCHVSDVVLVQEHWLAPDRLHLLSGVHDDFIYFASSSMSKKLSSGVFRGRPFGGIGVFIKKVFGNMHFTYCEK